MTAVVVLVVGVSVAALAQPAGQLEVRAYIQPDFDIKETQSLRLVLEIKGGVPGSEISVAGLRQLQNLEIVHGPASQFNSLWSNGRLTSTAQLVYTLLPQAAGPAKIPALTVHIDGGSFPTEPIRFEVGRSTAGVPPRSGTRGGSAGRSVADADLFIRAHLGQAEVWVGESVSLSLLLYSTERFAGRPSLAKRPSLSSFWVEDIEVDPQDSFNTKIEGRVYVAIPQLLEILVPQTSGTIDLEPFVMQIPVRVRSSNDPLERFFGLGRTQTIVRKSQPLTLEVRPLPTAGRMDDFSGAVGVYTLKVGLDREAAAVSEAVALTATVEGEGFLRAVAAPILDPPPDIKLFDPKVTASSRAVRGKLVSRKSWEWILIPLAPGELQLPPLRFQYFDTDSGSYKLANKALPPLVVRQGDATPEPMLARGDIQLQHRDLAFIKPLRGSLQERVPRVHERKMFLTALLLPLAWAPLVVLAGRRRARMQKNLGLARSRKARSRARQRLRRAERRLDETDSAVFHEQVARALVEYVADRFNRAAAGLTYQLADELLAHQGLEEPLRQRFRTCLEACDFARFVPSSSAPERRSEMLAEAGKLIDEMERSW